MSQKLLEEIHNLMCAELKGRLLHGEGSVDKETGELVSKPCSPATLNVIRQFLKDNSIDALPKASSPLGELLKTLPEDFEFDQ